MQTPSAEATPLASVKEIGQGALLARNWGFVLWRGVLSVIFGLLAVFLPGPTLASLVLLFSAYMLVDGVFAMLAGVRAAQKHQRWGWLILEGIANIPAAAIAFVWPGITVVAFVLLIAFWALLSGVFMLGAAFRLGKAHGRGWLLLAGVVSLLWGVLLVAAPVAGAVVLTLWLGAYALAFGIALTVLALRLRREHRRGISAPGAGAGHPAPSS